MIKGLLIICLALCCGIVMASLIINGSRMLYCESYLDCVNNDVGCRNPAFMYYLNATDNPYRDLCSGGLK